MVLLIEWGLALDVCSPEVCFSYFQAMTSQSLSLQVSPAIGAVTAEYIVPAESKYIMTLAHGAGAGMNHVFMTTLAGALAEAGIASLRFNFPFAEHKKMRPDTPATAHQTIAAAITHAYTTFPALPLFTAGKSFGGRMTSQYLAVNARPEVKGIIFYGFPLHPSGKPSVERAEHLKEVKARMLFIQGTRDELASWDLITSVCASLPKAKLVKIEGANHMFKAGKLDTLPLLVHATQEWIQKIIK
jgi:predicted alpha/beta-hydrolase family hydrolase